MRLIDNLEELKEGDFVSRDLGGGATFIYKVFSSDEKEIQLEVVTVTKYIWEGKPSSTLSSERIEIRVPKRVRKTKKRKLRKKLVTYNDSWIIFKLNDKEKGKILRQMILDSLK